MRASGRFPVAVDATDDGDAYSHKGRASASLLAQNLASIFKQPARPCKKPTGRAHA
jgi:hypothetical protein